MQRTLSEAERRVLFFDHRVSTQITHGKAGDAVGEGHGHRDFRGADGQVVVVQLRVALETTRHGELHHQAVLSSGNFYVGGGNKSVQSDEVVFVVQSVVAHVDGVSG